MAASVSEKERGKHATKRLAADKGNQTTNKGNAYNAYKSIIYDRFSTLRPR